MSDVFSTKGIEFNSYVSAIDPKGVRTIAA
jgi:hypothetical protein